MIEVIQWPPVHNCVYSLLGRRFEQEPDEPFVTRLLNGKVDVDLQRQTPGWINRIQRFGIQNGIPEKEWSEETIYYSLLPRIHPDLRGKFFRQGQSNSHTHPVPMALTPHTAPIPPGLAKAAGFAHAADDDPDTALRLAALTADKWLAALRKWVSDDPDNRKTKTAAGPPWWYALHTLALNPDRSTTPGRFVGVWKGLFPCRKCRIGASAYIARNPVTGWEHFKDWANDIHNYVTARK